MSFSVHNGYRATRSAVATLVGLETFRARAREVMLNRLHAEATRRAVHDLDRHALGLSRSRFLKSPYFDRVEDIVRERQSTRAPEQQNVPLTPLDADIQIFLPNPGDICAIAFFDDPELAGILTETTSLAPYPYWDNSHRPDDVDETEWQLRRRLWTKALRSTYVPADHGLAFALWPADIKPYAADFCKQSSRDFSIPPAADRLRDHAIDAVSLRRYREAIAKDADRISAVLDFNADEPHNAAEITEWIEANRGVIPNTYSRDELLGRYQPAVA